MRQEEWLDILGTGAKRCREAISILTKEAASVRELRAGYMSIEELMASHKGGEEVIGVAIPIRHEGKAEHRIAAALLTFSRNGALDLGDLLLKAQLGEEAKGAELQDSALMEFANIITGQYLSVLANELKLSFAEEVPDLKSDFLGAIVDSLIMGFADKAESVFVSEIVFEFEDHSIEGSWMFFQDPVETEAVPSPGS